MSLLQILVLTGSGADDPFFLQQVVPFPTGVAFPFSPLLLRELFLLTARGSRGLQFHSPEPDPLLRRDSLFSPCELLPQMDGSVFRGQSIPPFSGSPDS